MLTIFELKDKTVPYGIVNEFNHNMGRLEYMLNSDRYVYNPSLGLKAVTEKDLEEILKKLRKLNNVDIQ